MLFQRGAGGEQPPPSLRKPTSRKEREKWGTLYNRVGVVKRHVDLRKVLTCPLVEGFGVAVVLAVALRAHATNARL